MSAYEQIYTFTFEAAHDLAVTKQDVAEHRYKRLHGHSFFVEVTLRSDKLAPEGWVMDFEAFKDECHTIREALDHRLLNEIENIGIPTLENIAAYISRRLSAPLAALHSIKVSRPSLNEAVVFYP